nr:fibroblast growth factor receptor 4-like [Lepeophtheirus salmonis]
MYFKLLGLIWSSFLFILVQSDKCTTDFCSCPPFLQNPSHRSLYFTKYPYMDHYGILGKAKDLHCCVSGNYSSLIWYKNGIPFPWPHSSPIFYAGNKSLVLMDFKSFDEGQYTCVASDGVEKLTHTTYLRSYELLSFRHEPIWKIEPVDVLVEEGSSVNARCAATVGPQFDELGTSPLRSKWEDSEGQKILESNRIKILDHFAKDDMVLETIMNLSNVTVKDAGPYTCIISNGYGVIGKTIKVVVRSKKNEPIVETALQKLLYDQLKIIQRIILLASESPGDINRMMKIITNKLKI